MKRKIVSLCLVLVYVIGLMNITTVYGEETAGTVIENVEERMEQALEELQSYSMAYSNSTIDDYNSDYFQIYGLMVPVEKDAEGNVIDPIVYNMKASDRDANNEYRYLGMDPTGQLINNPVFIPDNEGKAQINGYDWQPNPLEDTRLRAYYNPDEIWLLEKQISDSLLLKYGNRFNPGDVEGILSSIEVVVPATTETSGIFRINHKWDSNGDGTLEDWYITINTHESLAKGGQKEYLKPNININENEEDGSGGSGTGNAGGPLVTTSTSVTYSDLLPNATGRIDADALGNEAFNVSVAIPSSESLYVLVDSKPYLHTETYTNVRGTRTYNVTVSKDYTLRRWDDSALGYDDNNDGINDRWEGDWVYDGPHRVTQTYHVTRTFSLWTLDAYYIQGISNVNVANEVLPGGSITADLSAFTPSASASQSALDGLYTDPAPSGTVDVYLGTEIYGNGTEFPHLPRPNWQATAEANVGQFLVSNDSLVFNGYDLMQSGVFQQSTPAPSGIPNANVESVINQSGIMISPTQLNGVYETEGTIVYGTIQGTGEGVSVSIPGLSQVTVHTPVVAFPSIGDISRMTQYIWPESDRLELVVEETFILNYPTEGQHIDALGYGQQDYSDYFMTKQVLFPFDVYQGSGYDGDYLEKNVWHDFDVNSSVFFVPMWAEEMTGDIRFRSIPINIPDMDSQAYEFNANLDRNNYKAVELLAFNLTGQMIGFTINDCYDDTWKNYFDEGRLYAGIDAANLTETQLEEGVAIESLIPIMPEKIIAEEDMLFLEAGEPLDGVMLGYPIEYSLATNGDLYSDQDYLFVRPRYYYVPIVSEDLSLPLASRIDMNARQEVDVYVESSQSLEPFNGEVLLGKEQRYFIGSTEVGPESISDETKEQAFQRWDGTFYLPNMSCFVPKGTQLSLFDNIDVEDEPFLRNGYIIVNLEIYGVKGLGDEWVEDRVMNQPTFDMKFANVFNQAGVLPYSLYGEGWIEEGYVLEQLGLRLNYGDVIFYSTEHRASQTYY